MALKDAWAIPEFRRLLIGNGVNMLGSSIFIIGFSKSRSMEICYIYKKWDNWKILY